MSSSPFVCDQKKVPWPCRPPLHRARQRALPVHVLRQHVAAERADVARGLSSRSTRRCASRFQRKSDPMIRLPSSVTKRPALSIETGRVEIHHAAGPGPHERVFTSIRGARAADQPDRCSLTPCGTV